MYCYRNTSIKEPEILCDTMSLCIIWLGLWFLWRFYTTMSHNPPPSIIAFSISTYSQPNPCCFDTGHLLCYNSYPQLTLSPHLR